MATSNQRLEVFHVHKPEKKLEQHIISQHSYKPGLIIIYFNEYEVWDKNYYFCIFARLFCMLK